VPQRKVRIQTINTRSYPLPSPSCLHCARMKRRSPSFRLIGEVVGGPNRSESSRFPSSRSKCSKSRIPNQVRRRVMPGRSSEHSQNRTWPLQINPSCVFRHRLEYCFNASRKPWSPRAEGGWCGRPAAEIAPGPRHLGRQFIRLSKIRCFLRLNDCKSSHHPDFTSRIREASL